MQITFFTPYCNKVSLYYNEHLQPGLKSALEILKGIDWSPRRAVKPVAEYLHRSSYAQLGIIAIPLLAIGALMVYRIIRYLKSPYVKATVWIENTREAGPIQMDKKFNFKDRLRDEHKKPLNLACTDLYLKFQGNFTKKDHTHFVDAHRLPDDVYLPSSLFEGRKSGDVVRFYLDDKLVEFTLSTDPAHDFREDLKVLQEQTASVGKQGLFAQDIEDFPRFKVGEQTYLVGPQILSHPPLQSLKQFDEDQALHGNYALISRRLTKSTGVMLDIHRAGPVKLEEIYLVQTKGPLGFNRLFVFIPHRPEYNRVDGTVLRTYDDGKTITVTQQPSQETRLATYKHGSYYVIHERIPDNVKPSLSFSPSGYLLVTIT